MGKRNEQWVSSTQGLWRATGLLFPAAPQHCRGPLPGVFASCEQVEGGEGLLGIDARVL